MTRGRERSAVIHCWRNRHARRHLIIKKSAHFSPQHAHQLLGQGIVTSVGSRVDAAGEAPLNLCRHGQGLFRIVDDNRQRRGPEGFGLQRIGRLEKLLAGGLQQRISETVSGLLVDASAREDRLRFDAPWEAPEAAPLQLRFCDESSDPSADVAPADAQPLGKGPLQQLLPAVRRS